MTPKEVLTLRMRMKLNKKEFGKLIGVTAETITNWERGKYKPSRCWIRKMLTM